jgi:hypothetical protein
MYHYRHTVRSKRKERGGGSERQYIGWRGTRKYNSGFEGSQAVPACPSDMGNVYNQIFYFL